MISLIPDSPVYPPFRGQAGFVPTGLFVYLGKLSSTNILSLTGLIVSSFSKLIV